MDEGFDTTEWDEFIVDLGAWPEYTRRASRAVIEHGAFNVTSQLRTEMRASEHFGQIAAAISYDIIDRATAIEALIGPVKGSPGSLANIAYFGTSRGGGTVPEPYEALLAEIPATASYLADQVVKGILR